jgi:predicted nucleic acid-binding protein
MKKILLDINVILDILLDRKPHVAASALVWMAIETGKAQGLVPAHGVTTIHYLVQHARGAGAARRTVDAILQVLDVAAVDGEVLRRAMRLGWPDLEDAVTAAAAEAAHCDAIVSRDPKGFPASPVPVITPEAAAALVGSS